MSLSLQHIHVLRTTQKLTVVEQLKLWNYIWSLKLQLIEQVRRTTYRPFASCPACSHKLTPAEIMQGFNNDPRDYTTACTKCKHRFEPKLVARTDHSSAELWFYCPAQTLAQLREIRPAEAEKMAREYPAMYHSAIVHFGSLRQAYAKIEIQYPHAEIPDWKNKIAAFLGQLPDTMIAVAVDKSVRAIRKYRKSLGINPYDRRQALEAAEQAETSSNES